MDTNDCTAHTTVAPLAPADAALPVALEDPRCPQCGAGLLVERTYTGVMTFRITRMEIDGDQPADGMDHRHAYVEVNSEARSDETTEVGAEFVVCENFGAAELASLGLGCSFKMAGSAFSVEWA